ncbi:IGFLR1 isoform 7, partial [Pan troglodytes]
GRLEYWNPDNKCCSSCLQRFGPPPCPGENPRPSLAWAELAEAGPCQGALPPHTWKPRRP